MPSVRRLGALLKCLHEPWPTRGVAPGWRVSRRWRSRDMAGIAGLGPWRGSVVAATSCRWTSPSPSRDGSATFPPGEGSRCTTLTGRRGRRGRACERDGRLRHQQRRLGSDAWNGHGHGSPGTRRLPGGQTTSQAGTGPLACPRSRRATRNQNSSSRGRAIPCWMVLMPGRPESRGHGRR